MIKLEGLGKGVKWPHGRVWVRQLFQIFCTFYLLWMFWTNSVDFEIWITWRSWKWRIEEFFIAEKKPTCSLIYSYFRFVWNWWTHIFLYHLMHMRSTNILFIPNPKKYETKTIVFSMALKKDKQPYLCVSKMK